MTHHLPPPQCASVGPNKGRTGSLCSVRTRSGARRGRGAGHRDFETAATELLKRRAGQSAEARHSGILRNACVEPLTFDSRCCPFAQLTLATFAAAYVHGSSNTSKLLPIWRASCPHPPHIANSVAPPRPHIESTIALSIKMATEAAGPGKRRIPVPRSWECCEAPCTLLLHGQCNPLCWCENLAHAADCTDAIPISLLLQSWADGLVIWGDAGGNPGAPVHVTQASTVQATRRIWRISSSRRGCWSRNTWPGCATQHDPLQRPWPLRQGAGNAVRTRGRCGAPTCALRRFRDPQAPRASRRRARSSKADFAHPGARHEADLLDSSGTRR